MAQHHDKSLDVRKAKTAFPGRIVDLMIFIENRFQLRCRDANAGVPYFDPHSIPTLSAAEQNPSLLNIS